MELFQTQPQDLVLLDLLLSGGQLTVVVPAAQIQTMAVGRPPSLIAMTNRVLEDDERAPLHEAGVGMILTDPQDRKELGGLVWVLQRRTGTAPETGSHQGGS